MTTESFIELLARIEESVRASDGEAILARWDFGRAVLDRREGKQLPKGVLVEILTAVGISTSELNRRVQVAEHYARDEVSRLRDTSHVTWSALVAGLPKKRAAGTRSPKPPNPGPTAATHAEADRVAVLIAKPDVAAELARRAKTDAAAAKATTLVERQQRAEAKAQKERDQETQRQAEVLRSRLFNGDSDWRNLTEQLEVMADTLKRIKALIPGLSVPDPLHRKMFERQLAAAQQELFELRRRVVLDDHEEPPAEVWTTSVIETVAR